MLSHICMGDILMKRLAQSQPLRGAAEAVVNLLLAASWTVDRLERALAPLGITHAQYNVLRILRGAGPKGHPRCEIARRMIDRAPDVTRLIDRLRKQGLVERARGVEDRREAVARATTKGLSLLEKADAVVAELERGISRRMSAAELGELSRLCETIYGDEMRT